MNKLLLALVIAGFGTLTSTSVVEAQFGLRGGMNLSRFVGADADNVKSKTGLRAGGSLQLFNLGPIAIVPEIYYSQVGATQRESIPGEPQPVTLDFSLDYLEVPVLAKLYLPLRGARAVRPCLAAGPAFVWNLNCEVELESAELEEQVEDCRGEQFQSVGTAFRSADRGVVVGGGIDLGVLGMGAINLDARLVRGLARLTEGSGEQPDLKNQSFSLMLGYSFGTGGFR